MKFEDYTIEFLSPNRALLSWDGGTTTYYWTIFVNGRRYVTFEEDRNIQVEVPLNVDDLRVITIVRHSGLWDYLAFPDEAPRVLPSLRWVSVQNAYEYVVYELDDDGNEYPIYHVPVSDLPQDVYTHRLERRSYQSDLGYARIKVKARSSFGESDVPSAVIGFVGGFPAGPTSVTVSEDSSSNLVLSLA